MKDVTAAAVNTTQDAYINSSPEQRQAICKAIEETDNKMNSKNDFDIRSEQVVIDAEEVHASQNADMGDVTAAAVNITQDSYINGSPDQRQAMRKAIYNKLFPTISDRKIVNGISIERFRYPDPTGLKKEQLLIRNKTPNFIILLESNGNSRCYEYGILNFCKIINENLSNVQTSEGLCVIQRDDRSIVTNKKPELASQNYDDISEVYNLTKILEENYRVMGELYKFVIEKE